MTRRSIVTAIVGLFPALAIGKSQREVPHNAEANVMLNACVVNKGYELNPQECQECGGKFVFQSEIEPNSQRPNFCPNCGGRNTGLSQP